MDLDELEVLGVFVYLVARAFVLETVWYAGRNVEPTVCVSDGGTAVRQGRHFKRALVRKRHRIVDANLLLEVALARVEAFFGGDVDLSSGDAKIARMHDGLYFGDDIASRIGFDEPIGE